MVGYLSALPQGRRCGIKSSKPTVGGPRQRWIRLVRLGVARAEWKRLPAPDAVRRGMVRRAAAPRRFALPRWYLTRQIGHL